MYLRFQFFVRKSTIDLMLWIHELNIKKKKKTKPMKITKKSLCYIFGFLAIELFGFNLVRFWDDGRLWFSFYLDSWCLKNSSFGYCSVAGSTTLVFGRLYLYISPYGMLHISAWNPYSYHSWFARYKFLNFAHFYNSFLNFAYLSPFKFLNRHAII